MPRRLRSMALAALALLAAAPPGLVSGARAQGEIRSIVVPAEGAVVIPPRSAPRLAARPTGTGAGIPIPPGVSRSRPVLLPDLGTGLAAPALGLVLPALAGALLGGSIAGARAGGSSAPARTR